MVSFDKSFKKRIENIGEMFDTLISNAIEHRQHKK